MASKRSSIVTRAHVLRAPSENKLEGPARGRPSLKFALNDNFKSISFAKMRKHETLAQGVMLSQKAIPARRASLAHGSLRSVIAAGHNEISNLLVV